MKKITFAVLVLLVATSAHADYVYVHFNKLWSNKSYIISDPLLLNFQQEGSTALIGAGCPRKGTCTNIRYNFTEEFSIPQRFKIVTFVVSSHQTGLNDFVLDSVNAETNKNYAITRADFSHFEVNYIGPPYPESPTK